MSDPLSISASIIAVLQLTGTVVQYLNDVKGASEDRQRILAEISSTSGVLFLLKDLADRAQWENGWSVTIKSLTLPGGPLDNFMMILKQLASKLKPVEGTKKVGRALIWPFQKVEINKVLSSLERQKTLFNLALQNDHIVLSRAIKTDVTSFHDKVDEVNRGLAEIKLNQTGQESRLRDQDFRNILAWLSPLDFPVQQSDLISRRQEGTGEWVFESSEFKTWINGTRVTLFCPGIPGAGKTMLASIVVDYLLKMIQAEDVGIAYMYCTYRNRLEQTPIRLLASLLKQLLQERHFIPDGLRKLYEHHVQKSTFLALDEITTFLHSEMVGYSKVFIVVDALDECAHDDDTHEILLSELNALQTTNPMNLMITSRHILKIEQKFQEAIRLEIRASDADVQKYLEGHMSRLASCVTKNISLQETIKSEIVKAVDGMFLLAQLHLDSLTDKTSPKAIKKALEKLPKGSDAIGAAYNEAMERINSQKPGFKQLAEHVLSWITYAARPLTVLELRHALAVEPGERELDEENLSDIEELVSVCAGLVIVDQESNIVRLVHYTTQEYLERVIPELYPEAQQNITIICLTYLLFDAFKDGVCLSDDMLQNRLQQNHLLDYATHYWWIYPLEHEKLSVQSLALKFLMDDSRAAGSSQVVLSKLRYMHSQYTLQQFSGLHLVSYFGVQYLAMLLLEKDAKLEAKDGKYGRTPLSWAAEKGHEGVVALLLQKGADIEPKDNSGWTPLSRAARRGQEAVVALLLENGADIESKDNSSRTPLSWAAEQEQEAVVALLLEKGADIESKDSSSRTPLLYAAGHGQEAVVALLLQKGADIESKDNSGLTPLSRAARRGQEAVIALLLEKGADIESKDNSGWTPLSRAAGRGQEAVVALLLKKGADIESKDNSSRTPLSWAAEQGQVAVVALLLEKGADIESKDSSSRTPLLYAAGHGQEAVVALLLQKGADIESKDNSGLTPLSRAARRGQKAVVALLLEKGADIESKDNSRRTPLSRAARRGQEAVVALLLEKGADIESKDEDGRTPLSWAAALGHESVVALLNSALPI